MNLVETVKDFLDQIVALMKADASVSVDEENGSISATIEGEDAAILIGREGRTLDALQLITSIVANKGQEERSRVFLDIEGYREKRIENIKKMAQELAERVAQEGEPLSMEPMNAFERREVHMALRESTSVMTESQGEGSERHITIKPL